MVTHAAVSEDGDSAAGDAVAMTVTELIRSVTRQTLVRTGTATGATCTMTRLTRLEDKDSVSQTVTVDTKQDLCMLTHSFDVKPAKVCFTCFVLK